MVDGLAFLRLEAERKTRQIAFEMQHEPGTRALLKKHLWSFPKAIEEIDEYRTSCGVEGISNSLLNGISYVLGRNPLAGPHYVGWEITFRCNAKCQSAIGGRRQHQK
jgi:hypothetical protein